MYQTDEQLANNLQECLDRIAHGETREQCLAAYPNHRAELEPLLQASGHVRLVPRPALPLHAKIHIKAAMLRAMPITPPIHPIFAAPGFRFFSMLILLGVVILFAMVLLLLWPRPILIPVPALTATSTAATANPTATLLPTGTITTTLTATMPISTTTLPTATTLLTITATPERINPQPTMLATPTLLPLPTAVIAPTAVPGGSDGSDEDKQCQGLQLGRDEKKCEPREKPGKDKDDKGKRP
jgi:hypothetical protein